jgi:hypothetical protein
MNPVRSRSGHASLTHLLILHRLIPPFSGQAHPALERQ